MLQNLLILKESEHLHGETLGVGWNRDSGVHFDRVDDSSVGVLRVLTARIEDKLDPHLSGGGGG